MHLINIQWKESAFLFSESDKQYIHLDINQTNISFVQQPGVTQSVFQSFKQKARHKPMNYL